MPRYSIGPGLPLHAASTAQALAVTSSGRGSTVSCLYSGGDCNSFLLIVIHRMSVEEIISDMPNRLHSFGYLDTKQRHTLTDNLCNIARNDKSKQLLIRILFVQDAIVVIELVESLCQFITVIGDAAWTVV